MVVGGGPTGLMLAGELSLAGVDAVVVERRTSGELDGSRAGGLHARTIEVLDQRGIADRFLAEGTAMQVQSFAGIPLDLSDFPTRHNYGLALWQRDFERILDSWVTERGVSISRGQEVVDLVSDDGGVDVRLADGGSLRASYLVGCDGGRSLVRKKAGIAFAGWAPSVSSIVAEVEVGEEPAWGLRRDERGQHGIGRLEDGRARVVVSVRYDQAADREPTLEELRRGLVAVWGTHFGVHSPSWISRFTDATRQAESYRAGRVFLAGDAAHVHYPIGGQGLNLGVQDAVNLGWKLGQVVKGTSPAGLLDTYQAERHPVAARVLRYTMAQTALARSDDRTDALRETVGDLLGMDEPRKLMAAMVSGLDIRYDLGEGHPLLGRRMPDLDLDTSSGPTRVFPLLHEARPVLLDLGGESGRLEVSPWSPRLKYVEATYGGAWELPVLGEVPAACCVLIRPDGHVAWTGEASDPSLADALEAWVGRRHG